MRTAVVMLLAALLTLSGHAPDPSGSAVPEDTTYQVPFDPAQVTADLSARDIVVLPGSIARFDRARVDALTADGNVKVLIAPPGPLDSEDNQAYRAALSDVTQAVEEQWDGEVVRVTGVEVDSVGQDTLADVRHLLSTFEVTSELEFITPYLQDGTRGPSSDEVVTDTTDPALTADLIARLGADAVVVADGVTLADPSAGVPNPEQLMRNWRDTTGTNLRLVVLPPLAPGEPAGVRAADLAPAFPDDVVVLIQGRWLDVAGPDQQALTVARDMTLSRYMTFLESRQIGPANVLKVLGDQYAELTSGAVQDQPTPTQRNPLSWLLLILPWLALLLVVVFGVRNRARRKARRAADTRHDGVADLAGAAAALPVLAAGILALDGLARTGPAREQLARATIRYRAAGRLVADGQDGAGAAKAVLEGRQALTEAARLLDVPNVPGALPTREAVG